MHCYQTLHSTTWARRLYRVHNVHLRIVHRVHTVHQIGDDAASIYQQSDLILMTSVYIAYLSDHTCLPFTLLYKEITMGMSKLSYKP